MTERKDREQDMQGEGDKRSARKFNEKGEQFVQEHDTGKLGREARPKNREQQDELKRAESDAARRVKEHDPNEVRRKGPS